MAIPTVKETKYIGDELTAEMEINHIDGEYLDTCVHIDGEFWVDGGRRDEFAERLGQLIDEYRI